MSTRANIHFTDGERLSANIYRHSDGYPSGLGADLHRFLDEAAKLNDNRFSDAEYLAAKYLVWQASEYNHGSNPLDFLSVSPCIEDHGDIEYLYKVVCENRERPKIFVHLKGEWREIESGAHAETIDS